MPDPVAGVEKIVKLGLAIKQAVDTVRHNQEECREIRKRVLRFSAILSQLQQAGLMSDDSPALSGALEDLEESIHQALELVMACQERSTIRRLISAGDLAKQLRRVKDDILNKVMLASFAINAHTTILLLTIQAGSGHPLLRQQEDQDTGVMETSHKSVLDGHGRSELNGERNNIIAGSRSPFPPLLAFRKYELSELKAATNNFAYDSIIGQGGHSIVYKGVLNDGNVVSIKTLLEPPGLSWARSYDIHRLVSKFHNKNIVKILGFVVHEEFQTLLSSLVVRFFKRKEHRLIKPKKEYYWVEEYIPNGSLDKITNEPQFHWSPLFRIIEGIAQGMHYLHEQGIIHMDMKPSNVLLDSNMNPKIVDFGISEILNENQITCDNGWGDDASIDTYKKFRGTIGYVAPEYIAEGIVSKKNDVYAFGITLIQIVGSICMFKPLREYPLDEWAWRAWESGVIEELFDQVRFDESQIMEIKRCLVVGLLCTQLDPANRPTMTDVLQMLWGLKELPTPKKPHYMGQDDEELSVTSPPSPSAFSDVSLSPR